MKPELPVTPSAIGISAKMVAAEVIRIGRRRFWASAIRPSPRLMPWRRYWMTRPNVLIDLVNQYQRQGMSLGQGLTAGAQKRRRPNRVHSAAARIALIPMALGVTGNSGFIAQPLAVVVIGGLITSTLLTLVIVPVLYRIAEGPGERRRIREEELAERRRRAREEAAAERARQEQAELAAGQPEASPRGGPAPAAGPAGPAGPAGSAGAADPGGRPARRRSLKERGGIVGMIRRRLGRG